MELAVMEAFFSEAPDELWPTLIITEFKDTARHCDLHDLLKRNGYSSPLKTKLNLVMERRPRR